MQITGTIKVINANIQVSATFSKSEMVIVTNEQYPQSILIEFAGDKADLVDPYGVGQEVTVSINLRGRLWVNPRGEDKYFNSIHGWRIQTVEKHIPEHGYKPTDNPEPTTAFPAADEDDSDPLPF